MSRPKAANLIKQLDKGFYLVNVDGTDRASALPVSSREAEIIIRNILGATE